jgi:hypothetical protein
MENYITLKWTVGPKGMGKTGNITLYVADIDRVVAIDVTSGKISNSWKVSGASCSMILLQQK